MAYHELRITTQPLLKEILIDRLIGKGCLGFIEEDSRLIAYFPDTMDIKEVLAELDAVSSREPQYKIACDYSLLPDQDWNESWKKGFKPIDVGKRFTILPPWEQQTAGRINLIIDPGMAFGTGHHETTRSCLLLMEKYDGKVAKDRFLDFGAGTGLLAIAASKLGYREVVAVDTDPLAIKATRMNADLNGVTNIEILEGSIDAVPGRFNCITANIISGVLIELAPRIAACLNPLGIVILSGILLEQADEVKTAYMQAGLKVLEQHRDGKWTSLVLQKYKRQPESCLERIELQQS